MKKQAKRVALLAALTLAATACQKENDITPLGTEQTSETLHVVYAINGEVYHATLSESEWDAFVERMLALARKGYEVTFARNTSSLSSQSKEVVTFVTEIEQEAHAWANDMIDQGYSVTISYDKKTGKYTCIATK
jgi:hypothetical protein